MSATMHTQSERAIDVQSLTCRYGDFTAVDDLTFHVREGELYALLGTNGAGKTTTLETIEGHRAASAGSISVLGGSPADRTNIRPRTGIMLQESGFAGDLTVSETLRLVGRLSGRTDDVARVLGKVDLLRKKDVRVGQLSGGEKRRLDFATAVFGTPELVFLDEPTTALDPAAREALWAYVAELRGEGVTIVLTTHYLEEAERYADRIGLMHQGRLRHEGALTELVAAFPASISFDAPFIPADLPVTPTRIVGEHVIIETRKLQTDLSELLAWANDHHVTLDSLQASSSGLADVFRRLTERTSEDSDRSDRRDR